MISKYNHYVGNMRSWCKYLHEGLHIQQNLNQFKQLAIELYDNMNQTMKNKYNVGYPF